MFKNSQSGGHKTASYRAIHKGIQTCHLAPSFGCTAAAPRIMFTHKYTAVLPVERYQSGLPSGRFSTKSMNSRNRNTGQKTPAKTDCALFFTSGREQWHSKQLHKYDSDRSFR